MSVQKRIKPLECKQSLIVAIAAMDERSHFLRIARTCSSRESERVAAAVCPDDSLVDIVTGLECTKACMCQSKE